MFPKFKPYQDVEFRVKRLSEFYKDVFPSGNRRPPSKVRETMVGKPYNNWVVTGLAERVDFVKVKCVCGTEREVRHSTIRLLRTNSCGCKSPPGVRKFGPETEKAIREVWLTKTLTNIEIGQKFNCHPSIIGRVMRNYDN